EIVKVTTPGDTSTAPIPTIGVGVFTSALREALLRNEVDVIVHSYKDLPTKPEPGIVLAAVPPREDPRDALIARDGLTLGQLPPGSKVGTGAPRSCARWASVWKSCRFEAISTPACARSVTASSTPSFSRVPDWPGSAWP